MTRILSLAATVALGAAAPAAATSPAICELLGHFAADAASARNAGISQRGAANVLAASIGRTASTIPGSHADRQYAASVAGAAATTILRLVYSLPAGNDPQVMGTVIYGLCLRGEI